MSQRHNLTTTDSKVHNNNNTNMETEAVPAELTFATNQLPLAKMLADKAVQSS